MAIRPGVGGRAAAVLLLIGEGADGPEILFVERAATMRTHAGQIAFPGGAADPGDADLADTALREAVGGDRRRPRRHRGARLAAAGPRRRQRLRRDRGGRLVADAAARSSAVDPREVASVPGRPGRRARPTRRTGPRCGTRPGYTGPGVRGRRPPDLGADRPPARRRARPGRLAAALGPDRARCPSPTATSDRRTDGPDPELEAPMPTDPTDPFDEPHWTRRCSRPSCGAHALPGQQPSWAERCSPRYAEPHRRYHTATHLRQVLTDDRRARRRPGPVPGPAGGLVPRRGLRPSPSAS